MPLRTDVQSLGTTITLELPVEDAEAVPLSELPAADGAKVGDDDGDEDPGAGVVAPGCGAFVACLDSWVDPPAPLALASGEGPAPEVNPLDEPARGGETGEVVAVAGPGHTLPSRRSLAYRAGDTSGEG